jgi:hypothetical protein
MLLDIFDIWEKLPTHFRIILAVGIFFSTTIKPFILFIDWIKKKKTINKDNDDIKTPFTIKFSSNKRKIKWYQEKLNNHNVYFQLNELIKYEIDSNKYIFGTVEKTRIFRQVLRIYLSVLADNFKNFYNIKDLDSLSDKEFSEHFDNFVEETHFAIYKKFKDNLQSEIFDLVIMNEEKGFVHYVEKHKKHFINSIKEIIKHDKKLYDNTNYRKVWEMLSLLRLVINVALDDFMEFYDNYNGDLDIILKK